MRKVLTLSIDAVSALTAAPSASEYVNALLADNARAWNQALLVALAQYDTDEIRAVVEVLRTHLPLHMQSDPLTVAVAALSVNPEITKLARGMESSHARALFILAREIARGNTTLNERLR